MILRTFISFLFIGLAVANADVRSNLTVRDVQVGFIQNKTKIVFELSKSMPLTVTEDVDNNTLTVGGPEDTFWQIPESRTTSYGGFQKYVIKKNSEGWRQCVVSLAPNTRVVGKALVKKPKGSRFTIDLLTEAPAPPPPPPVEPEMPAEVPQPMVEPQPPVVQITQQINTELHRNKVKQIKVVPKEEGTTWLVIRSEKEEYFDFQSISSDQLLLVYLPKTNWPVMPTRDLGDYNIATYRLDETNPNYSILQIKTTNNCSAVDQFMSPNSDGTNNFVLVLANRPATSIETQRLIEKKLEAQAKRLDQSKYSVEAVVSQPIITSSASSETPAAEVVAEIEDQGGPVNPFLKIPETTQLPPPLPTDKVMSEIQSQGSPENPFEEPTPAPEPSVVPTEETGNAPLFDEALPQGEEDAMDAPIAPEWVSKAKDLIAKNEAKKAAEQADNS